MRHTIPGLILSIALCSPCIAQPVPLVNGRSISPIGTHVGVGSFPCNMVVSPSGKWAAVTTVGSRQALTILDTATGAIASQVTMRKGGGKTEGLYYGLAFHDSGNGAALLYASRGSEEKVAVYTVGTDGRITETGRSVANPVEVSGKKVKGICGGIALDADGSALYIADNNTGPATRFQGTLSIRAVADGRLLRRVEVPGYPLGVAAVTAGPRAGARVYVSCERDGVVAAIDPREGKAGRLIRVGSNPTGLLLNGDQSRLYVANSGSDTISVIDTASDRAIGTILLRPASVRSLPGVTPLQMCLSPDGKRLAVALGDLNAVGLVRTADNALYGMVPTGWYPTAVAFSPTGDRLLVSSAKGIVERNPNGKVAGDWGQYILGIIEGTVSSFAMPSAQDLATLTARVLGNARIADARPARFSNPGIRNVIYIIKENRTYDQVFGDIGKGNGDASLCMFPRTVTPNQHALAERFALLDNYYCCAEVSQDGWSWSTSGMINESTARTTVYGYGGRGHSYDTEGDNNGAPVDLLGIKDISVPDGGYIWDNALRHGLSVRNFGFFTTSGEYRPATGPRIGDNLPNRRSLVGRTDVAFRQYDLSYADSDAWVLHNAPETVRTRSYGANKSTSRFAEWKLEFDQMVKSGKVPRFMTVRLPRDHTEGTRLGAPSPRAMVADNDYAVGKIVEEVSRSPFWKQTAIFVIEDDAQNGYDHVDAHRSTCLVVSPYVERGTVESRFHNTDSTLRTMELLLGLPPMCQFDAIAPPFRFFNRQATNSEPYTAALPAREVISEMNRAADYGVRISSNMDFSRPDAAPDALLNRVLWHAVMGADAKEPPIRRTLMRADTD